MAVPTLIGVTLIIFFAIRVIPGDPTAIQDETGVFLFSEEQREVLRAELGIDRPLLVQYTSWVGGLLRGDLGTSFVAKTPVIEVVKHRGPVSFQIGLMAVGFAWLMGVPLGMFGALRQNSLSDYLSRFVAVFLLAVPAFWTGLLFITATVLLLEWRPPLLYSHIWVDPVANLQMTVPPAIAMGVGIGAVFGRVMRSSVLEVLRSDFVRTSRAKGLPTRLVLGRHVLRNALLPILTISGLAIGGLIGGAVAVERAFSIPGLGLSLVTAIQSSDWPLIQSLVFLYALSYIVANIVVDMLYGRVDPRIRIS